MSSPCLLVYFLILSFSRAPPYATPSLLPPVSTLTTPVSAVVTHYLPYYTPFAQSVATISHCSAMVFLNVTIVSVVLVSEGVSESGGLDVVLVIAVS